jgi:hypothetical protein
MTRKSFIACLVLLGTSPLLTAADKPARKLKVVVLMGQSNMVGYAHPSTAWYLTQPMYVPPAKIATIKSETFNSGQFYWQGVHFAHGDTDTYNGTGEALLAESKEIIKLWRSRVYDNFSRAAKASGKKNEWNTEEWGPAPVDETGNFRPHMPVFLHKKIGEPNTATGKVLTLQVDLNRGAGHSRTGFENALSRRCTLLPLSGKRCNREMVPVRQLEERTQIFCSMTLRHRRLPNAAKVSK